MAWMKWSATRSRPRLVQGRPREKRPTPRRVGATTRIFSGIGQTADFLTDPSASIGQKMKLIFTDGALITSGRPQTMVRYH